MPYRITYPMEAEAFIRSIERESGVERDETTVKLAAAVTARVNKAYYRGKFGQGSLQKTGASANAARKSNHEENDPLTTEFLRTLHYHESAAFDAGRKERMNHDTNGIRQSHQL